MPGVAGSQPQDLANPNPVGEQQIAANKDVVNTNIAQMTQPSPQVNAPVPAPQQAAADPLEALADQHASAAADPLEALADEHADPQKEADASDDHAGFFERAKIGFAADDHDKLAALKKDYGAENVKHTDKGFLVREDGSWKHFNNNWFGMGDPANLVRQGVVEAGALPAEAAGLAASTGEAATGVGGIGAPATLAASRFAGGAMGEYAARATAGVLGLPRTGQAADGTEAPQSTGAAMVDDAAAAFTQGGVRALFGHLLDGYMSGGVQGLKDAVGMKQTAEQAMDKAIEPLMHQTQAALSKANAVSDVLDSVAPEKKASAVVQDAIQLDNAAKRTGLTLRPDELFPNDPKLQDMAKSAMASPAMREAVLKRGELAAKAVEQIGSTFKTGEETAQSAVAKGSVVDRAYGRLIGQFRSEAIANAEEPTRQLALEQAHYTKQSELSMLNAMPEAIGAVQGGGRAEAAARAQTGSAGLAFGKKSIGPAQTSFLDANSAGLISSEGKQSSFVSGEAKQINMSNLGKALGDLRAKFGFADLGGGQFKAPTGETLADLEQRLNLSASPGKTKFITDQVSKLSDKFANGEGKMDPREVDQLYASFKKLTDVHFDKLGANSEAFQAFKTIKNGLRDDFASGIGSLLGPEEKAQYQQAMGRFSEVKTASEGLKQLFGTDSPSTSAIVEYMRNGGIKNADRINDLKTVIASEHPESWAAIGKSYLDRMLADHAVEGAEGQRLGNVNWTKLNKTLDTNKKVAGQLEAIIGPERAAALGDLTKVMSAAQASDRNFVSSPNRFMQAAQVITKMVKLDPSSVVDILSHDSAASKLLSSDKAAALIAKLPLKQRATMQDVANKVAAKAIKAASNLAGQDATGAVANMTGRQPQP